jgi:hypothetical protein
VVTEVLYGAAALAASDNDPGWAGALVGAAQREGDFGHDFDSEADRVQFARTLSSIEQNLGTAGMQRAIAAGRAMTLDAAADYLERSVGAPGAVPLPSAPVDAAAAFSLVNGLDSIRASSFAVVGHYIRFDEGVRNALKDARQNIFMGLKQPGHKRNAHLIWAAPGSGKTYFVEQVAASLTDVSYRASNLAKCTEDEFLRFLGAFETTGDERRLCFIDECDAKPGESWPYELLLPCLDAAAGRGSPVVFVFAGSSGSTIDAMKERMASRPKGADLLSRIPNTNEYCIGPMGVGDRVLVALTHMTNAARENGVDLNAAEKMALYYLAIEPRLDNARQLREVAVRSVERLVPGEDRLKYDHLFGPGDPENKAFWLQWRPYHKALVNHFVAIAD